MIDFLGTIVDGNKILSSVGKGSIGAVYRGESPSGKSVAIKIMELTPFTDAAFLDSVIEAALATKKLAECSRIVKVYSAGKTSSYYYICMDFMDGGTLEQFINDGVTPISQKIQLAYSIACTLTCVHNRGFIHGDLKPGNVLINAEGEPYLIDFYYTVDSTARKSFPGHFPQGTPRYMSPEQALGQFITSSSDIYTFGVVLYELLTGKLPYRENPSSISSVVRMVLESDIIPASRANGAVDRRVDGIIGKLLQKKPEMRYKNMDEVAEALKPFIGKADVQEPCCKRFIRMCSSIFKK